MKIKKQTVIKILAAMLTILMLTVCIQSTVFATSGMPDPSEFSGKSSEGSTKAKDISETILGIVQVVAVAVAIIMLIVLGIKYITASPNDKADVKHGAFVYIIGAILLFGATGIIQMIKGVGETMNK